MGKKLLIFAGVYSLLQGAIQTFFSSMAIAQHFCAIDFLQTRPLLLFMKILYFHKPSRCGITIQIGQTIEGVANQAFVLIPQEPFTSTRTFILNCLSLGLGCIWLVASCILLSGGALNEYSRPVRWPWIAVTTVICAADLAAGVLFLGDTFHTRTLTDVMSYIGGTLSGAAGATIDTAATAWLMVVLYTRFGIFFAVNVILIILVGLNKNKQQPKIVEAPLDNPMVESLPPATVVTLEPSPPRNQPDETSNAPSDNMNKAWHHIPRAYVSQAYQNMKKKLLEKRLSVTNDSVLEVDAITTPKSACSQTHGNRRTAVNFPENLLSFPQRVEHMICEEHRKTDISRPAIPRWKSFKGKRPRFNSRVSAQDLKSQLPWSYTATPAAFYMRDDISSNEELPPVPLADYTALEGPSDRRASVHQSPETPRYQRRQRMEATIYKDVAGWRKLKRSIN